MGYWILSLYIDSVKDTTISRKTTAFRGTSVGSWCGGLGLLVIWARKHPVSLCDEPEIIDKRAMVSALAEASAALTGPAAARWRRRGASYAPGRHSTMSWPPIMLAAAATQLSNVPTLVDTTPATVWGSGPATGFVYSAMAEMVVVTVVVAIIVVVVVVVVVIFVVVIGVVVVIAVAAAPAFVSLSTACQEKAL